MKRWWCVEVKLAGDRPVFFGRVEATEAEMRASLGPHISLESNGRALVYGRPKP